MKTKTKMRMLSLLLCFVMLVGLMPTTVFAAKSATVTTYNELWSAVFSKDDYYITLGSDITYAVPGGGNTPLSPWQYLLNVNGTKNIVDKVLEIDAKLIYVSSVHSITEKPNNETITEITNFDSKKVVGLYVQ